MQLEFHLAGSYTILSNTQLTEVIDQWESWLYHIKTEKLRFRLVQPKLNRNDFLKWHKKLGITSTRAQHRNGWKADMMLVVTVLKGISQIFF